MDRSFLRHLDPEDFDENGTLRDGGRYRIPMRMMDSIPRSKIGDGVANFAANRPGYRIPSASMHDSKQQRELDRLYAERDAEISQAYLTPTGFGSTPSTELRGDQPGDVCTIDGWPGHLRKVNGKLVCVADDKTSQDARSIRDAAHQAYENDLVNAWRGSINEQTHDAKPRPAARSVVVNDSRERAIADYNHEIENAWRNGK
jgi:hypothetical protein